MGIDWAFIALAASQMLQWLNMFAISPEHVSLHIRKITVRQATNICA